MKTHWFLILIILLPCCNVTDNSQFNVLDFGAVADGITDNTEAFQSALDKAASIGGIVNIPAGQYKIEGVLTIPDGVTLKGIAEGPVTANLKWGTILLAYAGRDNEESPPFITLLNNSTIKGLSIYYPEQVVTGIHPYPWTIQIKGNRSNIIDLNFVNSYNGIDCGSVYHGQDYKGNRGPIKLTNCGFWGWAESLGGTHIVNKGEGTVYLTACNFNAKNWIECHWKPEIPFIKMENGTLQIMNSRFQDNGNTPDAHIYLGENVRSAVIIGNSVEGGDLHVTNKSKGDVQIMGNVTE